MRKEVLFAVIFGVILGGIILFGINLANNSVNNSPAATNPTPTVQNVSPTPTPQVSNKFDILIPQDHSVITEDTTTIRGTAKPNSSIAIMTESNDLLIEASQEGTFSAQINLVPGVNKIKVVQADKDHNTQTISLSVIQSDTIPE